MILFVRYTLRANIQERYSRKIFKRGIQKRDLFKRDLFKAFETKQKNTNGHNVRTMSDTHA